MTQAFFSFIAIYSTLFVVTSACQRPASDSPSATSRSGATTQTITSVSLSFKYLSTSSLYTTEAKTNTCATFVVSASDDKNKPLQGIKADLSLAGVSADERATWGTLSTPLTTAADGQATGTFCSASKTGNVIIVATYKKTGSEETSTANSGSISITLKPVFSLSFKGSNLTSLGAAADAPIQMNLLDSGPNDCGFLDFLIKKSDDPQPDVAVKFQSNFGYPTDAKLRLRSSTGDPSEVDPQTGRRFLSYTATSDADGLLRVPICAGTEPGNMLISANYTDSFGKSLTVKSPPISVGSGFASLLNLNLRFDQTNARTLRALFNNETPNPLNFIAQLNSQLGGALSVLDPISVRLESGGLTFENNSGGVPDATGSVRFSVLASHNGSYRPTPVYYFSDSASQANCMPNGIASALPLATNVFPYKELAKNWRSTMVYMTRGQEPYADQNDNKRYDVGGDGFWDKNQDGTYTNGVDAVTFFGAITNSDCRCLENPSAPPIQGVQSTPCTEDKTKPSCFRAASEWFIDLPTPFIDVDENGLYQPTVGGRNMDRLIGKDYQKPNGQRDNDTLIWKSTTLPVYTGTSVYAIMRAGIGKTAGNTVTPVPSALEYEPALAYLRGLDNPFLWQENVAAHAGADVIISDAGRASAWRYLHAQGVCGTPVPGGTEIRVDVTPMDTDGSDRQIVAKIHLQPGDEFLDQSRQLLDQTGTGNTARVNFNISDHPAKDAGFPIVYELEATPCKRKVTGGEGVWCAPSTFEVRAGVDRTFVRSQVSLTETRLFNCVAPTWKPNNTAFSCESCPGHQRFDSATGTCLDCPAATPRYISSSNTCVACPTDKPDYEPEANTCNAPAAAAPAPAGGGGP